MMPFNTYTTQDVRCTVFSNGDYRFSAQDVATRFGISEYQLSKYAEILTDLPFASISFTGMMEVAKRVREGDIVVKDILDSSQEISRLKDLLGDGDSYKIVYCIPWLKDVFSLKNRRVYTAISLKLRHMSDKYNRKIVTKDIGSYGQLFYAAYHVDVIDYLHQALLADKKLMSKWRI